MFESINVNFQIKDIVTSVDTKVNVGDKVRCNAWLLDESAKIPYLVSNHWCENQSVTDNSSVRDRILGMPEVEDLQVNLDCYLPSMCIEY